MPKTTRYVTVDIVVRTNHECDHLAKAFQEPDYVVQKLPWDDCGHKWFMNISSLPNANANSCIEKQCQDIASFPVEEKEEWEISEFKEFFIGYHVGDIPFCYEDHLSGDVIAAVNQLGAGIGLALYPAPDNGGFGSSQEESDYSHHPQPESTPLTGIDQSPLKQTLNEPIKFNEPVEILRER